MTDEIVTAGEHPFRLAFHLGPSVDATLSGTTARLRWDTSDGSQAHAVLSLPEAAIWRFARGETDPPLGWYSPRFGEKQASITLLGSGTCRGGLQLVTTLSFSQ